MSESLILVEEIDEAYEPTEEEILEVISEFNKRKKVPKYVYDVIDAMPKDTHPMVALSAAVLSLEKESVFVQKYNEGMKKSEYWESTYEDAMNLLAKMGEIGAYIYRKKYKGGEIIPSDPKLDFGGDFTMILPSALAAEALHFGDRHALHQAFPAQCLHQVVQGVRTGRHIAYGRAASRCCR